VTVVGTGRIAPGIAAWCASGAEEVRIAGRTLARAETAAAEARALLQDSGDSVQAVVIGEAAFESCDLVIESVVEDRAVKLALLSQLDGWAPTGAVLATNTSGLSVNDLCQAVGRDEFVGLHFLYPAHLTPLVELIPAERSSPAVTHALSAFALGGGKTPIVVRKDVPGFLWNRLQFAILRECLRLLDEGVADAATIDAAVADGLAPRWLGAGPLATVDLGGPETFARVAVELFPQLACDEVVSPQLLERAAAGVGFYDWAPGSRDALEAVRARGIESGRELSKDRKALDVKPSAGPMRP
jgi:3-hydroxybutyryl-CoA dehydrogenase